eukprot:CAMPEP_0204215376 /NCGR_PEP_ID=MMETSP0361-20130328/77395_1 /ASSEMBLY_ACC=CAM_ASM_000343 /TAXON_ID=268821 /ORGANISM="Scrippsiella Hangoei, Strain SHTV-5" /LENGTH=447 /DNA_ID=CAMNT_0051180113 /DNA_START=137 /DNA_END=1481 /DNA_ORIENTATION=+
MPVIAKQTSAQQGQGQSTSGPHVIVRPRLTATPKVVGFPVVFRLGASARERAVDSWPRQAPETGPTEAPSRNSGLYVPTLRGASQGIVVTLATSREVLGQSNETVRAQGSADVQQWRLRVSRIVEWFAFMVDTSSQSFFYTFDPATGRHSHEGGRPIRELASCWMASSSLSFCKEGGREFSSHLEERLHECVSHTLECYLSCLVWRGDLAHVAVGDRGADASIAHSAMLILSMMAHHRHCPMQQARLQQFRGLAAGIVGQQGADGSFEFFFIPGSNMDPFLGPAEAIYALVQAHTSGVVGVDAMDAARKGTLYLIRVLHPTLGEAQRRFCAHWHMQAVCAFISVVPLTDPDMTLLVEHVYRLHGDLAAHGFFDLLVPQNYGSQHFREHSFLLRQVQTGRWLCGQCKGPVVAEVVALMVVAAARGRADVVAIGPEPLTQGCPRIDLKH